MRLRHKFIAVLYKAVQKTGILIAIASVGFHKATILTQLDNFMKRSAMFLLAAVVLWSCNTATTPAAETATHSDAHEHEHAATTLALNSGQKWKADVPTNENVGAIRTTAQNFAAKPHATVADYQAVGSDLQKGVDKLIQQCKMSGPDHDALHLWLEPLLKDVNELKKADDIASSEKTFNAINERLELYAQYFE